MNEDDNVTITFKAYEAPWANMTEKQMKEAFYSSYNRPERLNPEASKEDAKV